MKNITVITTVHPLKDIRIFFKQIKSLKRKYKNINYIVQHDRDEIIDGVNIISLPSPKNRFQRMVGVNFLAFRKALRLNSEVYHLHDPELLIIGYMLKKSGKKVIFDSLKRTKADMGTTRTPKRIPKWCQKSLQHENLKKLIFASIY